MYIFKMILTKKELYGPKSKVWINMVRQIDKNPTHGEIPLTVTVAYALKPHYFREGFKNKQNKFSFTLVSSSIQFLSEKISQ